MGTLSRSKAISPVPSTSCAPESPGEDISDDPHALIGASRQPFRSHKSRPPSPPLTFRQLRRPLRQGERLLLTLLAEQCVDAHLRQGQEKKHQGASDAGGAPGDSRAQDAEETGEMVLERDRVPIGLPHEKEGHIGHKG